LQLQEQVLALALALVAAGQGMAAVIEEAVTELEEIGVDVFVLDCFARVSIRDLI
jgi:hypothetical protein